jgi:hypothetical protein
MRDTCDLPVGVSSGRAGGRTVMSLESKRVYIIQRVMFEGDGGLGTLKDGEGNREC